MKSFKEFERDLHCSQTSTDEIVHMLYETRKALEEESERVVRLLEVANYDSLTEEEIEWLRFDGERPQGGG